MGESAERPHAPRRPMISRAFVEAERRRILAAAAVELADEFGIGEVRVTLLTQLASFSRGTFYELFANAEDCMRRAVDEGFDLLFGETVAASQTDGDWQTRVEAAREALFCGARERPALARFTLIHARALPRAEGRPDAEAGIDALAALLARRPHGGQAVGAREEFVARTHVALLERRLRAEDLGSLGRLAEELRWSLDLL